MVTYGSKPESDYSYFYPVRDKNKITICFYTDVEKFTDKENKEQYRYNEYRITIDKVNDIEQYIKNHYKELFYEAKNGPSAIQYLMAKVDYLTMMIEYEGEKTNGTQPKI